RRRQNGLADGRDVLARLEAPGAGAAAGEGPARRRPEALAGGGLVHHAEHGVRAVEEPDQRSPKGLADYGGPGSGDRVDPPAVARLGVAVAELLADEAMVR